jgi:ketosteroid isomerase-like protein
MEIVRDSFDVLADGGLDVLAEFWSADITWRAIEGAPDDVGEMHGARRHVATYRTGSTRLTTSTAVAQELLDVGDDRVVAVQHLTGRARLSGVETGLRYAVVYTLREGKIAQVRGYRDRAEALKAVGLAR